MGDCYILLEVKRFNDKVGHRFLYLLGFKHVLLYPAQRPFNMVWQ